MVFATSSRSSTERHGDFSESVVFHFRPRCPFWFWVLGCLCCGFLSCFFVVVGDTLIIVSPFLSYGGNDNQNKMYC